MACESKMTSGVEVWRLNKTWKETDRVYDWFVRNYSCCQHLQKWNMAEKGNIIRMTNNSTDYEY